MVEASDSWWPHESVNSKALAGRFAASGFNSVDQFATLS
jgi:hypothetical protein